MTAEATVVTETPLKKELKYVLEESASLKEGERKAFPVPRKKFSTGELRLTEQ